MDSSFTHVVETARAKLRRLIRSVRDSKTLKTAYATIMGFGVMRALRRGQAAIFSRTKNVLDEARIVGRTTGTGLVA